MPLGYDTRYEENINGWKEKYPPNKYPVLAFTGAPSNFPILQEDVPLQKYLKWSDDFENKSNLFFKDHMNQKRFIGIHLRNGVDFVI